MRALFKDNIPENLKEIKEEEDVANITQKDLDMVISKISSAIIDVKGTANTYTGDQLQGASFIAKKIIELKNDRYLKGFRKIVGWIPYFFSWLNGDVATSQRIIDKNNYFIMVAGGNMSLNNVPKKIRDKEIYLAAVTRFGTELKNVPIAMRDMKICLAAVTQNGWMLTDVPKAIKDSKDDYYKICLAAVTQNGSELVHVPIEMRDMKICLAAVTQCGFALIDVPKAVKDSENDYYKICLAAVAKDGWMLMDVPEKIRNKEIYITAVKQLGYIPFFVPDELKEDVKLKAFP